MLDQIEGLGPARRAALIEEFGSVAQIRRAEPAQIAAVRGISVVRAESILEQLAALDPEEASESQDQ